MIVKSKICVSTWLKILFAVCFFQLSIVLMISTWLIVFERVPPHVLPNASNAVDTIHEEQPQDSIPNIPTTTRLFVAILSHSSKRERRDAIRDTWLIICKERPHVQCRFFSDEFGLKSDSIHALRSERDQHKDLEILNATESFAFAERLLLIWEWITNHKFKYDFFLRIDDDHFLCLDRLLNELQYRPKESLYWGFVHCHHRLVRVDEAWLLVTHDLIQEIMDKKANKTLYCHPYGDQAVAMWINNSRRNITYFMDNNRIVHKSAGRDAQYFRMRICEKHLSLHGTYPKAMKQLWLLSHIIRKEYKPNIVYDVPKIVAFSKMCHFRPVFEYNAFLPEYQFKPKLCHLKPEWPISKSTHAGREKEGERYSSY